MPAPSHNFNNSQEFQNYINFQPMIKSSQSVMCELKIQIQDSALSGTITRGSWRITGDQWMSVRCSYGHPDTGQGLFVSVCHCDFCDQQYRAAANDALVTCNPFPSLRWPIFKDDLSIVYSSRFGDHWLDASQIQYSMFVILDFVSQWPSAKVHHINLLRIIY